MRILIGTFLAAALGVCGMAAAKQGIRTTASSMQMDRDLLEVTVPKLQSYYRQHRYTVTQVVRWHLRRIRRYDGFYRAVEQVMEVDALATAAREDAEAARGVLPRGLLWGVPVVLKANTSIAGEVTTDGWSGQTIAGHELRAAQDAPIVAKVRAAGAVIIGHANMPYFANSDTTAAVPSAAPAMPMTRASRAAAHQGASRPR